MSSRAIQLGPDVVVVEDDRLLVFARREMEDWSIREFSKTCIVFEGQRFYPRFKHPEKPPFAIRYELLPWPVERTEPSGRTVYYDESYVREREAAVVTSAANSAVAALMVPLYPIFGLAWRSQKRWFADAFGVPPVQATRASLLLEGLTLLGCAIFWSWTGGLAALILLFGGFGIFEGWTAGMSLVVLVTLVSFALDVIVRVDQIMRQTEYPDGVFEWVTRLHKPEPLLAPRPVKPKSKR